MRAAIVPTTQELEQEKSMLRIAMTSTMGRGVFATRDIPGNTKVAVYPGFIYPPETVNADPMHSKYAWEMKMAVGTPGAQSIINGYSVNAGDEKGNVLPQFGQYAAPFVNEPNTPGGYNIYPVINFTRKEGQALEYWSMKPIRQGQQLFICYQRSERQRNGTLVKRCPNGPSVKFVWGNNTTPMSRPSSLERYLTVGRKRERRAREVVNTQKQPRNNNIALKRMIQAQNNARARQVAARNAAQKRQKIQHAGEQAAVPRAHANQGSAQKRNNAAAQNARAREVGNRPRNAGKQAAVIGTHVNQVSAQKRNNAAAQNARAREVGNRPRNAGKQAAVLGTHANMVLAARAAGAALRQYHAFFLQIDKSKKYDMLNAMMSLHKSGLVTENMMEFVAMLTRDRENFDINDVAMQFSLLTDWLGTGDLAELNKWVELSLFFYKHARLPK